MAEPRLQLDLPPPSKCIRCIDRPVPGYPYNDSVIIPFIGKSVTPGMLKWFLLLNGLRKAPIYLFYLQSLAGCQVPINDGGCFERRALRWAGGGRQDKHRDMGPLLCSWELLGGKGGAVVEDRLWERTPFSITLLRWICCSEKTCMKPALHKARA